MPKSRQEIDLENKSCAASMELGWVSRKLSYQGRRGAPDRLFLHRKGASFFCEFKDPQGQMSVHQDKEVERLRDAGMEVAVVDTIEAFNEVLHHLTPT